MRYTNNIVTISSYKRQLNDMVKICNKNMGLVNESYSHEIKRVINHKITKFNKILEADDTISRLYNTYSNIDEESSNIKAYTSLLYVFNNKPLSVMESLNLAKSFDNSVSLSLKDDTHNAMHSIKDIMDYNESLKESCSKLYGLINKFEEDNRREFVEASKIYVNFLESEINYINKVLTGEALDMLNENFVLNNEYHILTEALNISNTMSAFRKVLDGIFNMIKNTGITYKVKSMNINRWKSTYSNRMDDKVEFTSTKETNDKEDKNISTLSLTYYDKNANISKNILRSVEKFYSDTPAFDKINDVSQLETIKTEDIDNLTRENILKTLRIKDNSDKSIADLILGELKLKKDGIVTSGMTIGQLIELYSSMCESLKLCESMNQKSKAYCTRYEAKIKSLGNKIKTAKAVDKAPEADIDLTKTDSNDPNKKDENVKKDTQVDKGEEVSSGVESKINDITASYIASMNIVVALTQSAYTCVYTTIKEIERYMNNLSNTSSNSTNGKEDPNKGTGLNTKDKIL